MDTVIVRKVRLVVAQNGMDTAIDEVRRQRARGTVGDEGGIVYE